MEVIVLNVDSRLRDRKKYPFSSRFSYELETPIRNVSTISLSSVEFPNVSYIFSSQRGNNFFSCNNTVVTIPDGNYSVASLVTVLSQELAMLDINFLVSYSDITGKVTIQNNNTPFSIDFSSQSSNPYGTLGERLGFQTTTTAYTNVQSIQGASTLDTGENYFFLRLNDYGKVGIRFNENQVFAKIINTRDKFTTLYGNRSDFISKTHEFRQPVNIFKLDFEILDYAGNPLDNLNIDFSLTVEVSQIYNSTVKVTLEKGVFGRT